MSDPSVPAGTGFMRGEGRQPTYFLSHGGGPWPYLDGPIRAAYAKLERSLKGLFADSVRLPHAVLMVTAHWEDAAFSVSSHPRPPMIYDYSNFPEHTYHVHYRAPGSPDLAQRVHALLDAGGVACRIDPERGFDHGTYCIMEPARPEADIPVVQLSIKAGYDPREHIAVGRLLAPLRDQGVVIIGSGLSYHNLRLTGPAARGPSSNFDTWLNDSLVGHSGEDRLSRLAQWEIAPSARKAHPREDHLLPLMVAVGAAAEAPGHRLYHEDDFFGAVAASSFRFG